MVSTNLWGLGPLFVPRPSPPLSSTCVGSSLRIRRSFSDSRTASVPWAWILRCMELTWADVEERHALQTSTCRTASSRSMAPGRARGPRMDMWSVGCKPVSLLPRTSAYSQRFSCPSWSTSSAKRACRDTFCLFFSVRSAHTTCLEPVQVSPFIACNACFAIANKKNLVNFEVLLTGCTVVLLGMTRFQVGSTSTTR